MTEEKGFIWAGIDVSKRTFFAALDIVNEAEKLPVAKLPAKEFKRNKDGVASFIKWADERSCGNHCELQSNEADAQKRVQVD